MDRLIEKIKGLPIGARTIKTGIAVAISMFICEFFAIPHSVFAGSATVANMQPAVGKSLKNAGQQIMVHFIAISVAIILGLLITPSPLLMGVAAILIIAISTKLKISTSFPMGIVAAIFVLDAPYHNFLENALIRSAVIFIGVGVAVIVNITIMPPKYEEKLKKALKELNEITINYYYKSLEGYMERKGVEEDFVKKSEAGYEKTLKAVESFFDLYKNEWQISTKTTKAREDLIKTYISYNKILHKNTKDIIFLAKERVMRRAAAGNPEISPEFISLNNYIKKISDLSYRNNSVLLEKIISGAKVKLEPTRVWSRLDPLVANWQRKTPMDNFYLHGLMEVSIIIYKVRWTIKETIRINNEC